MRGKQQEEQEKAIHPAGATITPPVLEPPQSQEAKNQRTPGKKLTNQQPPASGNALHQGKLTQNGTLSSSPSATPKKREIKRRQPFDVYQDQVDLLKKISLKAQLNGEIGSMSRMVREALDTYLKDKQV